MCRSSRKETTGKGGKNGLKKRWLGRWESVVLHASVKILFGKTWEPGNNLQHKNGQVSLLTHREQQGSCKSISS